MAITGNSSSTETVKTFNLYTGIGKAKVLAINPNPSFTSLDERRNWYFYLN